MPANAQMPKHQEKVKRKFRPASGSPHNFLFQRVECDQHPLEQKFPSKLGTPTPQFLVLGAAAPKRRVLGDERAIGGSVDGLDLLLGNPDTAVSR